MPMIDAALLKPLVAEVERTRAEWEKSLRDPTTPAHGNSADFHMALYALAGTVAGLIEGAESSDTPVRLH